MNDQFIVYFNNDHMRLFSITWII